MFIDKKHLKLHTTSLPSVLGLQHLVRNIGMVFWSWYQNEAGWDGQDMQTEEMIWKTYAHLGGC